VLPSESKGEPEYVVLVRRAQDARTQALRLQHRAAELRKDAREAHGHTLIRITQELDCRRNVCPEHSHRLKRLSLLVGRDPRIEEAKLVMRNRFDITGAQAFELLRHISQTKNRKLRDVARDEPRQLAVPTSIGAKEVDPRSDGELPRPLVRRSPSLSTLPSAV
jgi:ANTAR domain